MEFVQAEIYLAEICDSTLDLVHGFKYRIAEIFIPEAKICINEKGFAFENNKSRADLEKISVSISKELVENIKKFIVLNNEVTTSIKALFVQTFKEEIDKLNINSFKSRKQSEDDINISEGEYKNVSE